jgi:hypothetical protein
MLPASEFPFRSIAMKSNIMSGQGEHELTTKPISPLDTFPVMPPAATHGAREGIVGIVRRPNSGKENNGTEKNGTIVFPND